MNYPGHEELRQDIARLASDISELHQRVKFLEQKYRWSSTNLTDNIAGQLLRIYGNELARFHRNIFELDLIFSD